MTSQPTVKSAIVAAFRTLLAGHSAIGAAAIIDPAGRSDEDAQRIATAIIAGKFAVELMIGHDVPPSDDELANIEQWEFVIGCLVYLPEPLPRNLPGSGGTEEEPVIADVVQTAQWIHREIYALYAAVAPGQSGGDPTFGGLAQDCKCLGGGGPGLVHMGDAAMRVTEHALRVHYRHYRGDMKEAA